MTNAVAYLRVSTDDQANEGVSLEAQKAAVVAYVALHGLTLVEVLVDAGVSGGSALGSREAGSKLLGLLKAKRATSVVAVKLDRLFRNSVDALQTTSAWDKAGVSLHLLDLGGQSINTGSAVGRFLFTMLAACAEMERGLAGERTRTALRCKQAKGERISRHAPMGTRHENGQVLPDPREQAVIAKIKKLHALGYKPSKIAKCLNDAGVPARGKCWYANSVSAALAA